MKKIKVALVHDTLLEDGGSEKVLLALSELFPEADIFTSFISSSSQTHSMLRNRIRKSITVPSFFTQFLSFSKLFINTYWEGINFDQYDLVISSTHSFFSKSIITKPQTIHLCYCHTPPKFLYGYETESRLFSKLPFSNFLLSSLRQKDYIISQRPDLFIANSKETQRRIMRFYGRESFLMYPPVKMGEYKKIKQEDYFVIVSRLTRTKRIELAIQACNSLNKKLFIIGEGPEKNKLEKIASDKITFLGNLPDQERDEVVRYAKGFIICSENEDFGIAPVEALALGVPVIAFAKGGLLETVKDSQNGVHFNELNTQSLIQSIQKFESITFNRKKCHESSLRFSEVIFKKEFKKVCTKVLKVKY